MSHPAPWRLLVHDPGRGDGDPKLILAVVPGHGDVRPAASDVAAVDDVTAHWVTGRHGAASVEFTCLPQASVWRVEEGGKPQ